MVKLRKKTAIDCSIPSSSMGDIAFLLIIFFMVATTIAKDKTHVDLASSMVRTEVPQNATTISVMKNGAVTIDGENALIRNIRPYVRSVVQRNSAAPVILKIDKNTKYDIVDQVLQELRDAKARNINFPTLQETAD